VVAQKEIWKVLETGLKPDSWTSLDEIYRLVQSKARVGTSEPHLPWKRNVRNVLQRRKKSGEVAWDGKGSYRLSRGDSA